MSHRINHGDKIIHHCPYRGDTEGIVVSVLSMQFVYAVETGERRFCMYKESYKVLSSGHELPDHDEYVKSLKGPIAKEKKRKVRVKPAQPIEEHVENQPEIQAGVFKGQKETSEEATMDLAKMVNDAAKEKPKPEKRLKPFKGESVLDFIRRTSQ